MQRINVVVLNPLFLGTFVGTAVLQGLVSAAGARGWVPIRSPLLLAAAVLYVVGSFGVTMAGNVPTERAPAGPAGRVGRGSATTGRSTCASGRAGTMCARRRRWRRRSAEAGADGVVRRVRGAGCTIAVMCDLGQHDHHDAFGYLVDTPEIRALIDETRRLTAAMPDAAARVEALKPAFAALLAADGWLPDAYARRT